MSVQGTTLSGEKKEGFGADKGEGLILCSRCYSREVEPSSGLKTCGNCRNICRRDQRERKAKKLQSRATDEDAQGHIDAALRPTENPRLEIGAVDTEHIASCAPTVTAEDETSHEDASPNPLQQTSHQGAQVRNGVHQSLNARQHAVEATGLSTRTQIPEPTNHNYYHSLRQKYEPVLEEFLREVRQALERDQGGFKPLRDSYAELLRITQGPNYWADIATLPGSPMSGNKEIHEVGPCGVLYATHDELQAMHADGKDIPDNIGCIVIKQSNGARLADSHLLFFEDRLRHGYQNAEVEFQNYTSGEADELTLKMSVSDFYAESGGDGGV
ncbi:hypothetical protein H2199_001491 [Coniosporium tulheliwenetii]|uniref:Uncharacterized protein n=1 Tax=Coniosporium tulheliwenetii TaxID=3383036 RepID=A0ACC2ZM51_9PEZI|nr:hypothetical protein H2199_001491 [Cladosporium sp. JES 115]